MTRSCTVDGCARIHHARGLCKIHYDAVRQQGLSLFNVPRGRFVNPFVCVCPEPQADPAIDYGQCRICWRKPLSLFRSLRVDKAA